MRSAGACVHSDRSRGHVRQAATIRRRDAHPALMIRSNWRPPLAVLICGGLILTISLGTRHTFGLFMQPMTADLDWNRQTFAIVIAFQNLLYGLATPITGMLAD